MPKPRNSKPKGRARERGESVVFTTEFDRDLSDALESFVGSHKPKTTRRAILEWAVEEFLAKRGAWPVAE